MLRLVLSKYMIRNIIAFIVLSSLFILILVQTYHLLNKRDMALRLANNAYKSCLSAKYPNPETMINHFGEECVE